MLYPGLKVVHVQVHFIVAACENMISGTGMRPGDIVTASNGKTIEVRIYQAIHFFRYYFNLLDVVLTHSIGWVLIMFIVPLVHNLHIFF